MFINGECIFCWDLDIVVVFWVEVGDCVLVEEFLICELVVVFFGWSWEEVWGGCVIGEFCKGFCKFCVVLVII